MVLILLVLLIVGVSTAPVRELESQRSNSHDDQEVYKILKEGLLNDTSNLEKITTAFKVKPGQVKICISFMYHLCNDQDYYNTNIIWTNFNAYSLSGRFLFYFAFQNVSIFGFEWAGACDLDSDIHLNIKTSSSYFYEDQYINDSLIKLTQQVRVVSLNH